MSSDYQKIRNINGDLINPATTENQLAVLSQYKCADISDSTDPNYFGFVDKDGKWYIIENNITSNTLRYIKGDSDYTTNWTNRISLNYDYFYNIF